MGGKSILDIINTNGTKFLDDIKTFESGKKLDTAVIMCIYGKAERDLAIFSSNEGVFNHMSNSLKIEDSNTESKNNDDQDIPWSKQMELKPIVPNKHNLQHKGVFQGLNYQWWNLGPAWSRKKVMPAIVKILQKCKL